LYVNIVSHRSGVEAKGSLYTPFTLRGAFSEQNRDGTSTSKTDNTSDAVIDPSDAAQQT